MLPDDTGNSYIWDYLVHGSLEWRSSKQINMVPNTRQETVFTRCNETEKLFLNPFKLIHRQESSTLTVERSNLINNCTLTWRSGRINHKSFLKEIRKAHDTRDHYLLFIINFRIILPHRIAIHFLQCWQSSVMLFLLKSLFQVLICFCFFLIIILLNLWRKCSE